MKSKIPLSEAFERVEIDESCQIVGEKFLIRYDNSDDNFTATIWLIEGCKYTAYEVAEILKEQFPRSSCVEVRNESWFEVMHIDLEWSEMQHKWKNHEREFQKRVVSTLEIMSVG